MLDESLLAPERATSPESAFQRQEVPVSGRYFQPNIFYQFLVLLHVEWRKEVSGDHLKQTPTHLNPFGAPRPSGTSRALHLFLEE